MLTIAITESDKTTSSQNYFFRVIQNFELNIFLGKEFFTKANAEKYMQYLSEWLKDRSYIRFTNNANCLFRSRSDLGVLVYTFNKPYSGFFGYRLLLPGMSYSDD